MGVIITILWVLFVLSAILLSAIVLLQEGKGGGLAEAFGGVGAEAFGVKAGGVSKFTAILAGIFLGSAVLVAALHKPTVFRASQPPPTESSLDRQAVPSTGSQATTPPSSNPGAGPSQPGSTPPGDGGQGGEAK